MVKNLLNLYITSKFYWSLAGLNILRVFKDAENVKNLFKSIIQHQKFYWLQGELYNNYKVEVKMNIQACLNMLRRQGCPHLEQGHGPIVLFL